MATRTCKLIGKAYADSGDVSLVINFNGTEVFNGTVPTTNASVPRPPNESAEVDGCTWNVDTSLSGNIPMSIAVSGGDFVFADVLGNYTGFTLQIDPVTDTPVIVDGQYVADVAPDAYYSNLNINTAESDGKTNLSWTGISDGDDAQNRTVETEGETYGDWHYIIPDGATLSCDFYIDPGKLVLTLPTL